jgi:tetratricopeptide (TPR) repeat protein
MFGSVPLFIIGIGIIWKQLFSLAIQPFMLFIESIYLPGGRLSKPVLNLKLPAYYFNKGRYYEALEEYKKVLRYYPDKVEAYERLIWMHYEIFNEVGEAKKLIRKAKRRHLVLDERVILAMERKSELVLAPNVIFKLRQNPVGFVVVAFCHLDSNRTFLQNTEKIPPDRIVINNERFDPVRPERRSS